MDDNINNIFKESTKKSVEKLLSGEELSATMQVMEIVDKEFSEKLPKSRKIKYKKENDKNIVYVIGKLNIKDDEEYERFIKINGKRVKYKIILKKGSSTLKEKEFQDGGIPFHSTKLFLKRLFGKKFKYKCLKCGKGHNGFIAHMENKGFTKIGDFCSVECFQSYINKHDYSFNKDIIK